MNKVVTGALFLALVGILTIGCKKEETIESNNTQEI